VAYANFLQFSKSVNPAPGEALISAFGRSADNKKPGIERRVSPSILPSSQGDGFTRSSIFFYPVLETKPTSQV